MSRTTLVLAAEWLDDDSPQLTLIELSHACQADASQLVLLVEEGVIEARGADRADWRFAGSALPRARLALRLAQDLHLDLAGTAFALDLLDEIAQLRRRLHRLGQR